MVQTEAGTDRITSKSGLRRSVTDLLRSTEGPDARLVEDRICSLEAYKAASVVFAYIPLKTEPDISGVLDRALRDGKSIAIPDSEPGVFRTTTTGWRSNTVKLANRTSTLKDPEGVLNLMHFGARMTLTGVILVPGLAFTEDGSRLGRGSGYYDRLFTIIRDRNLQGLHTVGVCRKEQVFEYLPTEPHDMKVDEVIAF